MSSLRTASAAERLRQGRTCYDHLAGRLGVGITDALLARRALLRSDGGFEVTGPGEWLLGRIGVDLDDARRRRRAFALACLDWTERRSHLAVPSALSCATGCSSSAGSSGMGRAVRSR